MSRKQRLILKCQIASSQIKVIFSCDYALFPPVSIRKKKKKQSKKHTNWWRGLVRDFCVLCLWLPNECWREEAVSLPLWVFWGRETGGVVAGVGWNWNDALFPLVAAPATVIKCLIVASWEFTLNISSIVIIIWVWVRGCNHLGLLFDEILGLVVPLYSHYFCVNSFP